ncbi:MAG: aromatic ring-hydroxylating dioxygenase subunit alpha [Betaproteobacteria bacterium]|nr:aromatic ring-hydroxylating dioxygenase subunit alpha [Betaproteobacteria bacterium]
MSNMPLNAAQLGRSSPQLPVSWYSDERVFALEQEHLLAKGPGYVGHELMVPELGDYYTLPWTDHAKMLVRNAQGVELISNVCRHRQAIMLQGKGNAENIVCPVHRWTYDLEGKLLGAPHFPENPCVSLRKAPLQNWRGLLFNGRRDVAKDLARLGCAADFDWIGFRLDHVEVFEFNQNWKTFLEVYLEDYHVEPFHPGLSGFVTCDDLSWELNDAYSAQVVGVNNGLKAPGTPKYKRWHDAVNKFRDGKAPDKGAIWMLYYPNLMLEWYPHVLIVSQLIPRSPTHTTNVVEFYYPEEIALFEREFVDAARAAYMETADEDDDIAKLMDRGRRALHLAGENDAGPYQSPLEDGMVHFHEYIRRALGPYL